MSDKPISTWTRFRAPLPPDDGPALDTSIFQPLVAHRANYRDAFYGRVAESPDQCILVVAWNSGITCDEFAASPEGGRRLLANLAAVSRDVDSEGQLLLPVTTRKVDFGNIPFWWRFGPSTEVRTVYFPAASDGEQSKHREMREAVGGLKGLVLSMGLGIDGRMAHLSPYRGVPECGWVIEESARELEQHEEEDKAHEGGSSIRTSGLVMWEGRQASACLWIHYWKDRKAEQRFKTNERRPPADGESHQPLAVEAFEEDLRRLGAMGWEDYHVDFEKLPRAL